MTDEGCRFGPELTNPLINVKEGSYSLEQMKQMIDVLFKSSLSYDVTFPVRAGLIASQESRNNLLWLLEQVNFEFSEKWQRRNFEKKFASPQL